MRSKEKRRIAAAFAFSLLAHVTALLVLVPLWALHQMVKVMWSKDGEGMRVAVLLALLLHLAIILPLLYLLMTRLPEDEATGLFDVELWRSDQSANQLVPEKEKTPEEELEEYEPEEELPEGQVVRAPPSEDTRKPDKKPRFVSERDNRVERESKARSRTPGTGQATSSPQRMGTGQDPQTMPGGRRSELMGAPARPSDLETAETGDVSKEEKAPPSLNNINLNPSMNALAAALAGTGLDHLEDVIEGDVTALNTAGWKHAAFFNRVKTKVEQNWHPDLEYRVHDPYGNIYGFKDRITVLLVVLRGDGSLKKAYIMEPSGAAFLDEEARRAVENAAPFPNVPEALKDKEDGLVKFTFHFLVEVGEQPVFRIRRYR